MESGHVTYPQRLVQLITCDSQKTWPALYPDRQRAEDDGERKSVLGVGVGERRGEAWRDHRTPFGAIGQVVKPGRFPCAKPCLDLPGQRKRPLTLRAGGAEGLPKRPERDQNAKSPRTEIRGLPGNTW